MISNLNSKIFYFLIAAVVLFKFSAQAQKEKNKTVSPGAEWQQLTKPESMGFSTTKLLEAKNILRAFIFYHTKHPGNSKKKSPNTGFCAQA